MSKCPLCCSNIKYCRHSSEETHSPGAHNPVEPTASLPWCSDRGADDCCSQRTLTLRQLLHIHSQRRRLGTSSAPYSGTELHGAVEQNISTLSVRTALPTDYPVVLETPNCNTETTPSQASTDSCIQTAEEATKQFVSV